MIVSLKNEEEEENMNLDLPLTFEHLKGGKRWMVHARNASILIHSYQMIQLFCWIQQRVFSPPETDDYNPASVLFLQKKYMQKTMKYYYAEGIDDYGWQYPLLGQRVKNANVSDGLIDVFILKGTYEDLLDLYQNVNSLGSFTKP